ncbi:MAG: hypothetical protein C4B59_03595 [Candidatus Methanogaster sp.]|uniref:Uncharacterized protein n=1 Tax=Candidatus Methanogaster sp. TaxID=3386292 RepID=A0AC61L5R7_9EURY|nr:MAG: hypothetical protein C4B59_03595 [ANME-2 cluster archaeon]
MGQRELRERVFHISKNGATEVYGHHPASMDRSGMDGRLWRDTYRIRRKRMQKRDVLALDLSSGFSDFERGW